MISRETVGALKSHPTFVLFLNKWDYGGAGDCTPFTLGQKIIVKSYFRRQPDPSQGVVVGVVVVQSLLYLTLCNLMDCGMLGFFVLHCLKLMSIELVVPSNHLILCFPLLLPPSIFLRVYSNELTFHIR